MNLTLTATVGVFQVVAFCDTTEEADQFVQWAYKLGDGEEREAIRVENRDPIDPPFDVPETAPAATVDDAVAAVKAYAARFKPDKARELMAQVGIARTSEITADIAAQVVELFQVPA
jgi:hypothetical protein